MPNWCSGYVEVKGKPKDIENFCKLFIYEKEKGNKKKPFFCRSFNQNYTWKQFKKEHLGKNTAEFNIDFAWSVWSCVIEGYPEDNEGTLTLKQACKKHKVSVIITSEEGGYGFEEKVKCSAKGLLHYDSFEMPTYKCKCGSKMMFPSAYGKNELDYEECSECGKVGKWRKVK